jgi:hypothetical protein
LRACLYALEDVLVFLVARKNNHGGLRQKVFDLARGTDAIHFRHGDVHKDDVWLFLAAKPDGLLAIVGHANHLNAGQHVHESGDTLGEKPLVVHNRHADDIFALVAQNLTLLCRFEVQYASNCIRCLPSVSLMNRWRY